MKYYGRQNISLKRWFFIGKIFNAIDRQIIRPRVYASEAEGLAATYEDIYSFYSQGNPIFYQRTGAYGDSVSSTGVSGGGGNYNYSIYLNPPSYSTGTYDGLTVLQEAQYHGSGILGRAGTWFESEKDIEEAIRRNFSR